MPVEGSTAARGLTYKVDIIVDGVKTRALLDHGAQVSLARHQLLPVIKERNHWTQEQCQDRSLKMEGQPQGAGEHDLGAEGMVALQVTIENTKVSQTVISYVELVTLVDPKDTLCEDDQTATVARIDASEIPRERKEDLESRLAIGTSCSTEERKALTQLMVQKSNVCALTDKELGQTDLMEYSIELSDSTPIRTVPRRLPYVLRSESEDELQKLLEIGCIEHSSSSIVSGLVLVRKKDGRLGCRLQRDQ